MSWQKTIQQIHASSFRAVLAVTGGGSRALADLISTPGCSRTLLEATVPYSAAALEEWLERKPDAACSRDTALSMASVAWARAARLAESTERLVGVACTASLVSDRPKRGDHRCWVAAQTDTQTRLYGLVLTKGARSRVEEDGVVSDLILTALAECIGCDSVSLPELVGEETIEVESEVPPELIQQVWRGEIPVAWSHPNGQLATDITRRPAGLLSGAFHPLHQGHRRLRDVAQEILGGPVYFEMAVKNADKPRLDFLSIAERRAQFAGDPLALTSAGLFAEKARLFPKTVFVIGFDTAERLIDRRFYGNSESAMHAAFDDIRRAGCRFLVAGRAAHGEFRTLPQLPLNAADHDLFECVPESKFRTDISSTEIRSRNHLDQ